MNKLKVSKMQLEVLRELSANTWEEGYCAVSFDTLSLRTGLLKRHVRLACRALKRKGLAYYGTTIDSENYFVSGSGYSCTDEGAEYIKSITPPLSEENNPHL